MLNKWFQSKFTAHSQPSLDDDQRISALSSNIEKLSIEQQCRDEDDDITDPQDVSSVVYADEALALAYCRQGVIPALKQASWGSWSEDDLNGLCVRGATFLDDKIKIPCAAPLYRLAHCDIFYTHQHEHRILHVAQREDSYLQFIRREREERRQQQEADADEVRKQNGIADGMTDVKALLQFSSLHNTVNPLNVTFIFSFIFPAPRSTNMNLVLYYERRIPSADVLQRIADELPDSIQARQMHVAQQQLQQGNTTRAVKRKKSSGSKRHSHSHSINRSDTQLQSSITHSTASSRHSTSLNNESHNRNSSFLVVDIIDCSGVAISRVDAFDKVLNRVLNGCDEERDACVKIIPRVAEGSWLVKKSIGRVPAILGRKLKQTYHFNPVENYIEIDADLGSSVIAAKIISLIKTTCKELVVDLSFLLQGKCCEELPESMLGGVRLSHVDLNRVLHYDTNVQYNAEQKGKQNRQAKR